MHRVLALGMQSGELRRLDTTVAAALVMGPVIQAATFRTYGRLSGKMADYADGIARGIWAAVANSEADR